MKSERDLCQSIAGIINGYRNNEFGIYDASHVSRWISQFDTSERMLVLEETNRILKKTYISKENFDQFIDTVINSPSVHDSDKQQFWRDVTLLNIQQNGSSQRELIDLFHTRLHTHIPATHLPKQASVNFIYLDDFIFSGNRLFSDLRSWITKDAPTQCQVQIIVMGWYLYGQYNTNQRLVQLANQVNKKITFKFLSPVKLRLENRLRYKDNSSIFWPTQAVDEMPEVVNYIAKQSFKPQYRVDNGKENPVFSRPRRGEYEAIMLKYGLKILSFSEQNSPVVKPLGYHTFLGFGFGSTVFSFRNCPNNNPLAFWWGDPTASPHHPFSRWYPLLQRKTYAN